MKRPDETDRGREETNTGHLLVSVLVTCVGLLARSDQVKGGPQAPRLQGPEEEVAQLARRSCTSHCPQTPEGPWRGND